MGFSKSDSTKAFEMLTQHPNYKEEVPHVGDSIITFTCRYIGNLISPPQEEGEDYDIECVDIKRALEEAPKHVESAWKRYQQELLFNE